MTDQTSTGEIWDRLDELSDEELSTLVEAAEHVIADCSDDAEAASYLRIPVTPAAEAIASTMLEAGTPTDAGAVISVMRDQEHARELVVATLRAIGREPALADEVASAYWARRDQMFVDAGIIAAGALLVLVLKLKRIKIGKVDVSFYEARSSVLEQLRTMLGR